MSIRNYSTHKLFFYFLYMPLPGGGVGDGEGVPICT